MYCCADTHCAVMFSKYPRWSYRGWTLQLVSSVLLRHVSPCGFHRRPRLRLSPFTPTPPPLLYIFLHSHQSQVCSRAGACGLLAQKKLLCEEKDKKKKPQRFSISHSTADKTKSSQVCSYPAEELLGWIIYWGGLMGSLVVDQSMGSSCLEGSMFWWSHNKASQWQLVLLSLIPTMGGMITDWYRPPEFNWCITMLVTFFNNLKEKRIFVCINVAR